MLTTHWTNHVAWLNSQSWPQLEQQNRISKQLLYWIIINLTWNHINSTVDDHCTLLNPVPLKIRNHHNLVIWVLRRVIWVWSQRNKELIYLITFVPCYCLLLLLCIWEINCFLKHSSSVLKLETWKSSLYCLTHQRSRIKDIGLGNACQHLICTVHCI